MKPPMRLQPFKGVLFLMCTLVLCLIVASFATSVISGGELTPKRLRIATVIQDILLFVVPAMITALAATRYPARFLEIDRLPSLRLVLLAVATVFCSIPMIDMVVEWNESLSLPSSMASLESWMKSSEANAESITRILMSGDSVGSLIVSILIVGVLAGFSEELFFRGTFQRLMTPGHGSATVAIWVTAFIFSAIHLQFYGFFPRLLLGAYLGYLLVWSGSLWLPVLIHVINNSLVVLSTWLVEAGLMSTRIDHLGRSEASMPMAIVSLVMVACLIAATARESRLLKIKSNPDNENNL